jgi:hypothetical protein
VKMHVKVFVGMEYECPRGHRFMASAPDRVMTQAHNPNRDAAAAASTSANKIVAADMPLYMGCPCRYVRRTHVIILQFACSFLNGKKKEGSIAKNIVDKKVQRERMVALICLPTYLSKT